MRGSALRLRDWVTPAGAPRGLPGDFIPVDPDQEGASPFAGPTRSDLSGSDTSGQPLRPIGCGAQGALLPETPARRVIMP